MFLAGDRFEHREQKIRRFLASEPAIALILAAVNFEWTVSRAIMFVSSTPNVALRAKIKKHHSPARYNDLWEAEVATPKGHQSLAVLVENWTELLKAFEARNLLVHGRDRYTRNMAAPHVDELLTGAKYIDAYCESAGYPLYARMPVRHKRSTC